MIRALKYAAVWLAFVLYHGDRKGAHACAKASSEHELHLFDKSELYALAAIVCFIVAAALALAALIYHLAS